MTDPLVEELRAAVGDAHVLVDDDVRAAYEVDWTGRYRGTARAVVRPADTRQVADVLAVCARLDAAVVPQGGNTGLVGGGVPRGGEVVISLRRLDAIAPVDRVSASVVVGAGATLGAVIDVARAAELDVAVDLAARDSATIGGMVATNAGGLHVMRWGTMREQVLGVEAVLADGTVVGRVPGLRKDNTGYSWPALLTGSEGTLGVVTRVHLRLVPWLRERVVAVVALDDVADAVALLEPLRARPDVDAIEVMFDAGVRLVADHARIPPPFAQSFAVFLLVEARGEAGARERLVGVLADALASPRVRDVAVATDERDALRLWEYRERHTDAINAVGVPHKLDVTLPESAITRFVPAVRDLVRRVDDQAVCHLFGHLGDGNLHVNVLGPAPDDTRVDDAVLGLVASMGGSISAEHGIGVAKRRAMTLTRRPGELAAMRAIKRALDPTERLNPGALF